MTPIDPSAFFADDSLERKEVPIPELAGSVLIRAMNAAQQDEYELALAMNRLKHGYRAYLAYHCTINEDGTLFFARTVDGQPVPEDTVIAELATRNPWGILDRIATAVQSLSAPPRDPDELKKNSSAEVFGGSGA